MKKALFAAAVLTAGFAMADIQSTNIVGYNNKGVNSNLQLLTGQFVGVAATEKEYKLSDLIVTGYHNNQEIKEAYGCNGSQFIVYQLNEYGVSQLTTEAWGWVEYFDYEGSDEWDGNAYWDDGNGGDPAEKVFAYGEAFMFMVGVEAQVGDDFKITSSGAVCQEDVDYSLQYNLNTIGNPLPKQIALADISVNGYHDNQEIKEAYGCNGSQFILYGLNEYGVSQLTTEAWGWVEYFDYEGSDEWDGNAYWDDGNGGDPAEKMLPAGSSYIMMVGVAPGVGEDFVVEFPSPLSE